MVFRKDLEHHIRFPNSNEDKLGRLVVGAAISTHPKYRRRISKLVNESLDFLLIDASDSYFEEGVFGLIPLRGSIFDIVPESCSKLKASLSTAGCSSILELHRNARLEHQSAIALGDSAVHGLIKDNENGLAIS